MTMERIPRNIISMWLGGEMPDMAKECVETHHKQPGFEHVWINNNNYHRCTYVDECIEAGRYGKASDYLRLYYLEKFGGIYMDADSKILKPLDRFLEHEMFVCEEENMFIANGIIGAVPHHPMIQHYLGLIERNFRGGGELVFQPGMYLWTELVKYSKWTPGITIYPAEWFLPYNHQTKQEKVTENTHCYHYYFGSWVDQKG